MKNSLILAACFLLMGLSSCKKDCTVPSLAENIVGVWKTDFSNSNIEFKADGTLLDPDGALIEGEINGVNLDEKSYEIVGETKMNVTAASGNQSLDASFDVVLNECDEIQLDLGLSLKISLRRQ